MVVPVPRQPDSKERLLRTASELILMNGYSATSVDSICEACGIKKGSFYHHFESKEQLAAEALDRDWEHFKQVLDQAFSPSRSPLDRIRAFLKANHECQVNWSKMRGVVCGCPLFSLGAEVGTQEPKLRQKVDEHLTIMARYFESTVREAHALGELHAPDPKAVAWLIVTFIEGALTLGRIRNSLQPILETETGVMRLLGIAPASSNAA